MNIILLVFLAVFGVILGVFIIGTSVDFIEHYSHYRDEKKEIPTVPYNSFKQFFLFDPDKYDLGWYHSVIKYKTIEHWNRRPYENWDHKITIDSYIGLLKAIKLIEKYKEGKLIEKLNNQKDKLTKEYLAEIAKNIEETNKKIDNTLQKEQELCIKRMNTLP